MSKVKPAYQIVMSEKTLNNIKKYKDKLASGSLKPGTLVSKKISALNKPVNKLMTEEFIEILLSTKKPKIFAESEVRGDGKDWTHNELELLGDINVIVPVKVYDNGVWNPNNAKVHDQPFEAELLFTPGALLKRSPIHNGMKTPTDRAEVTTSDNKIDQEKYNDLS